MNESRTNLRQLLLLLVNTSEIKVQIEAVEIAFYIESQKENSVNKSISTVFFFFLSIFDSEKTMGLQ